MINEHITSKNPEKQNRCFDKIHNHHDQSQVLKLRGGFGALQIPDQFEQEQKQCTAENLEAKCQRKLPELVIM